MFGKKQEEEKTAGLLSVYVLFDTTLEEGSPPFLANNDGHALRMYGEAQTKNQYKDDGELWHVGFYDKAIPFLYQNQPRQVKPTTGNTNAGE